MRERRDLAIFGDEAVCEVSPLGDVMGIKGEDNNPVTPVEIISVLGLELNNEVVVVDDVDLRLKGCVCFALFITEFSYLTTN